MKVLSAKQMRHIEALAYKDGASEFDFMEEAGSGVALVVHDISEKHNLRKHIILLCGKGNNGGDAYVAGIHLLQLDYIVTAYHPFPLADSSLLCKKNYERFVEAGGVAEHATNAKQLHFPISGLIIDGLFGTGFHGEISEDVGSLIRAANDSHLKIVAIDVPSGLNGDTGRAAKNTIVADTTIFLGLPKTGYFLRDGWNHVGTLEYVNFGLGQEYIDAGEADLTMLSPDMLRPLMPKISRNRNKYQAGYVIGLAGSPSMPGAALLASQSALNSGAGIVRLLHPEGMEPLLVNSPYELIKAPYHPHNPQAVIDLMNRASAAFVGPGLSLADEMQHLVGTVVPQLKIPTVVDADALTVLSVEDFKLPETCILTPHLGELKRLLHAPIDEITLEFLWTCTAYAREKNVTLVVKGGPTFIFHPDGSIAVNPRGDPGMATAGSGDALTGTLTALLAQKLPPKEAAYLGVYLHAVAGEMAAEDMTSYCMTASDIIDFYPDAFRPDNW